MNLNAAGCFLGGLGIGLFIGILMAPRSGRDTRDAIRSKAAESRDRLIHQAEGIRNQAAEWLEKGKDAAMREKEGIVAAFEEGKKVYQAAAKAG